MRFRIMKIHRFTGPTTPKALAKIHQELGPDALIHSTRTVGNGVEILASLPEDFSGAENFMFEDFGSSAVNVANVAEPQRTQTIASPEQDLIQRLNDQLNQMDEKVQQLSHQLNGYLSD